jgi:hypothetical protein
MTDEKLVTDFLNRECKLFVDLYSVAIKDKTRDIKYSQESFKAFLVEIFGNFKGLARIFDDWFYENEKVLLKSLYDYFDTLDLSKKSITLIGECSSIFAINSDFSSIFVTSKFEEYYIRKVVEPNVKDFFNDKSKELTSKDLESILDLELQGETPKVYESIMERMNRWYYDNEFYDKIMEFIKNTTIDLGPTNWIVKHKDYGTLDLNSLNKYFPNETKYQQVYFRQIFSQWYDDKVMEISEKMMEEF